MCKRVFLSCFEIRPTGHFKYGTGGSAEGTAFRQSSFQYLCPAGYMFSIISPIIRSYSPVVLNGTDLNLATKLSMNTVYGKWFYIIYFTSFAFA